MPLLWSRSSAAAAASETRNGSPTEKIKDRQLRSGGRTNAKIGALLALSALACYEDPYRLPLGIFADATRSSGAAVAPSRRGVGRHVPPTPRSARRQRQIWEDRNDDDDARDDDAAFALCLGKKVRLIPRGGASEVAEDGDEAEDGSSGDDGYDEDGEDFDVDTYDAMVDAILRADDEDDSDSDFTAGSSTESSYASEEAASTSVEESASAAESDGEAEEGEIEQDGGDDDAASSSETETETAGETATDEAAEVAEEEDENEEEEDDDPSSIHRREARTLRTVGKELHDAGDLLDAAITFRHAADELDKAIGLLAQLDAAVGMSPEDGTDIHARRTHAATMDELSDERATCVLHEALCRLKVGDHAGCVESCTDVLGDGVRVVPLDDEEIESSVEGGGDASDDEEEDESKPAVTATAAVVRITTVTEDAGSARPVSPAARARAYHRRAKARLALEDPAGALDDARSAAFLGDRNAVALYGRLMREHGGGGGGDASGGMGGLLGGDMSSAMEGLSGLMGNSNPFLSGSGDGGGGGGGSSALLESLMKGAGDGGGASPLGALGDLTSMFGMGGLGGPSSPGGGGGGGGIDSLAKSVLKNLSKRIDDEATQAQICSFLNKADAAALQSYASMAGMNLPTSAAERVAKIATGVTPRGLKKGVKWSKRALTAANLMRKTAKVIGKYRHLLVLALMLGWIKSAVLRPVKIGKRAAKAAAKAAAAAAAAAASATVATTATTALDVAAAAAAVQGSEFEATGAEAIEVTIPNTEKAI